MQLTLVLLVFTVSSAKAARRLPTKGVPVMKMGGGVIDKPTIAKPGTDRR